MNDKQLTEAIVYHRGQMDYHLTNADRARTVGSLTSAERSLADAAQHATIFTALTLVAGGK